ncbi:MAG TPA: peptidase T [Bacteroidota bacterium]|nr:peptidase T [Bacteroidota bacterium]
MNTPLLTRFLRYVKIDTQSSETSTTYPSTKKQFDLLKLLVKELRELGLKRVTIDKYGYVMGRLPGNLPKKGKGETGVPVIGLIAHVDTSPSASGKNVKPQVIKNYGGGDIRLPGDKSVVITVAENPELRKNIGKTIVTSDGTTLLGADDKAGIAIIMTALQSLVNNPSLRHGDIAVAFTPDEEIGAGTKYFSVKKFGADVAYTVDGDTPGELNRETFSADGATITVHGRNIHPGSAKNIMVNSLRAMADIIVRMPRNMAPETTEGYEPYIHPHTLQGEEEKTVLKLLLRDFRTEGLAVLRRKLETIIAEVRPLHPKARIELEVTESYRNMKEGVDTDPRICGCLEEAVRRIGMTPVWKPIRGGTDGSKLTAMGLPTPNLFTGGQNYHCKNEWVSVDGMEKSAAAVVELVQVWVEKSRP